MRRRTIIIAGLAIAVLLGAALTTAKYVADERDKELWRRTPVIGMTFQPNPAHSGDYCFEVGIVFKREAPRVVWEDVQIREYRRDGNRLYPPPGVRGDIWEGHKFCGFSSEGYYDFVYLPTDRVAWSKYPNCSGTGEVEADRLGPDCKPPEWA